MLLLGWHLNCLLGKTHGLELVHLVPHLAHLARTQLRLLQTQNLIFNHEYFKFAGYENVMWAS